MNSDTPMNESDYTVCVSQDTAFTIYYDDSRGHLEFTIEIGDDPKLIFLNPIPSDGTRMVVLIEEAVNERIERAVNRVCSYFNSKELKVQID